MAHAYAISIAMGKNTSAEVGHAGRSDMCGWVGGGVCVGTVLGAASREGGHAALFGVCGPEQPRALQVRGQGSNRRNQAHAKVEYLDPVTLHPGYQPEAPVWTQSRMYHNQ